MPSDKNDICRVYTGHMIFLLDDSAKHGHREIFDFEMHCERTCVINEQMPCDSRGGSASARICELGGNSAKHGQCIAKGRASLTTGTNMTAKQMKAIEEGKERL